MGTAVDLTGKRFGKLTVVKDSGERCHHGGSILWLCHCDCGNDKLIRSNGLRSKKKPVKSCGCLIIESAKIRMKNLCKNGKRHDNSIDLTGQRFAKLQVIEKTKTTKTEGHYWMCLCDCGNYVEVPCGSLREGHTKACGCGRNRPFGHVLFERVRPEGMSENEYKRLQTKLLTDSLIKSRIRWEYKIKDVSNELIELKRAKTLIRRELIKSKEVLK